MENFLENEKELVNLARDDDQAFEQLYNHYFPKIYGYVFKRVGHHETAEDIVSKTFTKVFLNLKDYEHKGFTFGAWVYKIATNNLIDHYRSSSKKKDVVDIENIAEPEAPGMGIDEQVDQHQKSDHVRQLLKELPEKDQQIVSLKYFAEMSGVEIAGVLEITENNARVKLSRALNKFHQIYEKYGE